MLAAFFGWRQAFLAGPKARCPVLCRAQFPAFGRGGKLLFSGFELPVNVPYTEISDYRKFMVIALFRNGEARRLYKVRTFNLE